MTMFINTLQLSFYEHVMNNVSFYFADIVIIGERIELDLKSGKIAYGPSAVMNSKKFGFNYGKKKEGEVQTASTTTPYWGGHTLPRYRQNYQMSSSQFPYVANTMLSYQQGPFQHKISYQAPLEPNNTYQPKQGWKSEADLNSKQGMGQGSTSK